MRIKKRVRVSDSFYADEYLPPEVYLDRGPRKGMELIDGRLIEADQAFREYVNTPVYINTYGIGGDFVSSGLRMPTDNHYSRYSQHSFGRASDKKIKDGIDWMDGVELLRLFKLFKYSVNEYGIVTFETPGRFYTAVERPAGKWLHTDVRNMGSYVDRAGLRWHDVDGVAYFNKPTKRKKK